MPAMLSSGHHALIQALLSRGPLKEKEFFVVYSLATGKTAAGTNVELFKRYLLDINKELAYVQFELRACRNQYDGEVYYGVVNNVSDEQSKLGTKYTPPQIAFYKGIIEAIVQDGSGQGSISNTDALYIRLENQVSTGMGSQSQGPSSQLPHAFKSFTMTQKEKTLEEFVRDRWLCSLSDEQIGLGVRSFLDLRSWFHNNEVPTCEVCNEAAVKAEFCQNEGCSVRMHPYCLKKKFSQRKIERVCPGCGSQWRPLTQVEAVEEDDLSSPQNLQHPERSSRKKPKTSRRVEAVEEEDDQCMPSQYLQPSERSEKKRPRTSQKAEALDKDDDLSASLNLQIPEPSVSKRTRSSHRISRDIAESSSSVTSVSLIDRRRVTRSSTRLSGV